MYRNLPETWLEIEETELVNAEIFYVYHFKIKEKVKKN